MDNFRQITPVTGSAADSLGQKTTLSRLKDAIKTHITIDNDWSAAIKIKRQTDPVVSALMQHDPAIFPPQSAGPYSYDRLKKTASCTISQAKALAEKLKSILKDTPSATESLKDDPVTRALLDHDPALHPFPRESQTVSSSVFDTIFKSAKKSLSHAKTRLSFSRKSPSAYPGYGGPRRTPLIKRIKTLISKAKNTIKNTTSNHIHIDRDWSAPVRIKKSPPTKQLKQFDPKTYSYPQKKPKKPLAHHIKNHKITSKLISFNLFHHLHPLHTATKKAAERAKHHAKNHFSFTRSNPAIEYLGRWERKYHRALHILSFLIPILILGYVIYMNILPFGYTGTLILDVGQENDMNPEKDIYLSDPNKVFTPVQRYGTETFREVKASKPFYLNFYAPINIDNRTRVTMDMDYEGDSPVYIEYFDDKTNKTYWRRYYSPGFRPELQGYVPLANYGSETIFAKRDLIEFKCRQLNLTHNCAQKWYWYKDRYFNNDNITSTDEWLMENAKYESVYFYNRLVDQKDYINHDIGYEEGAWTEINTQLRGTHEFYIYLNNSLNLTIWKQEFNWYNGTDRISVELWNMDGTKRIHQDTIPDDGIALKSSENTELTKNIYSQVEPGIYLLKLRGIKDQKSYHDYHITKIKINTNKIITKGNLLPVSETKLYTDAKQNSQISFYYWHVRREQDITVDGEDPQTIILSKENRSVHVHKTLTGKNTLHFPRGDVSITSSLHFAFNESNYFELYQYDLERCKTPSYLIYDGTHRSWIYKKDNIALMSENIKIKNIKLVFKHEPL